MPGRKPKKRPELPDLSLDLRALRPREYRTRQLNIKVSKSEFEEMKEGAKPLAEPSKKPSKERPKTGISDYLIGLHQQAVAAVSRRKKLPELPSSSSDPDALDLREDREKQVNVRFSPRELGEIKDMARLFKMEIWDYLIGLHRQAFAAVSRKKPKKGA